MRSYGAELGGLECRVVENASAGRPPELAVVLCHGFGAPGTDLVGLAPELFHLAPELPARFIFPAAPLAPGDMAMFGGRAWWDLDVNRLVMGMERGEFHLLREEIPPGLATAGEHLSRLVEETLGDLNLPVSRLVLGGFSQGAMVATDVALRLPKAPGGLCIFSGTLLAESQWRPLALKRGEITVLQSHGYQDQVLPFVAAEWLRDLLREAGMGVTFLPFHGGHEIPVQALERCAEMLVEVHRRSI
jgi:phospholipase/carboxylesterase